MFRSNASRTLLRSLNASPKLTAAPVFRQRTSQLCTLTARRPTALTALARPLAMQLRLSSTKGPMDTIDKKTEDALAKKKLPVDPEAVSTSSSVHPVFGEVTGEEKSDDTDMMAGVRSDLQTIKETFSLDEVPRQAYYIGLAGVLPYVATSLSTVFCAWEINHAADTGAGFLFDGKTAELLLHVLEPIQVGYGAAIISFLGAIHWGLEFAKYGGEHGYPRYSIGVINTALAWPTILMPVEYALISQFLLFTFSYYRDSRAARQGWAPHWYGVYRFVLTFIVGSAIVVSLIGRGQITQEISRPHGPAQRVRDLRAHQEELSGTEEEMRRKLLPNEGEDDEDDEEEEEGEEEEDDE
ncbi:related to MNN4-regulates the mannosylphosphorylation [Ramularia collo-cygni]|uniref:Related to MNN4-regulates the mannosylphosphorylation n=1 Tax=Ramularia collo-cygni TaxID=112498 RepID=A0A2D3UVJ5_9PEZI|nr:related to MNN4-regulates the mannosylphosphorylation [Ramularia collo-cygni]CZT15026.1 related to MNN4-regulates the mannosylphosphorylation [Ramularia collo-cygni]